MHKFEEYADKVRSTEKYYANHQGQLIKGKTVSEVVFKMCQLDKELER